MSSPGDPLGVDIPNADTDIFSCAHAAGTMGSFVINNLSAAPRAVKVWRYQSGGGGTPTNSLLPENYVLPVGKHLRLNGIFIANNGKIVANVADGAGLVNAYYDHLELGGPGNVLPVPQAPTSFLCPLNGGGNSDVYTCANANGALIWIEFNNHDAAQTETLKIFRYPTSAGTPTDKTHNLVPDQSILPLGRRRYGPFYIPDAWKISVSGLTVGDIVNAQLDVANL